MQSTIDNFLARFGNPASTSGVILQFPEGTSRTMWSTLAEKVGTGYFLDSFLYLFGERARELDPLPEHWSFLFTDDRERWVIGKNAYGGLLVLEDPTRDTIWAKAGLVDTLEVRYLTDPNLNFTSLIGRWLPQNLLPRFLDDRVYTAWRKSTGRDLAFDEILAPRLPLSVGGTFEPENFQVEDIFEYYRGTADIYRKYGNNDRKAG